MKHEAKQGPSLDLDVKGDPVPRDRRAFDGPLTDWGIYTQNGPSCDLDESGDPVPRKMVRR